MMSRTGNQRFPENAPSVVHESRGALALAPFTSHETADSAFGRHPVLAEIVEHAYASTHADGAALALEENGTVVCCARVGRCAPSLGAELAREAGISGWCLREGEAVRCDNAADDGRVDSDAARRLGIRSILAVPVKSQGATIGLLEVFAKPADAFGAEDEALLQIAAGRIVLWHELESNHAFGLSDIPVDVEEAPALVDAGAPPAPAAETAGVIAADSVMPEPRDAAAGEMRENVGSEFAFASGESPAGLAGWKRRLATWLAGLALAGAALGLFWNIGMRPRKSPANRATGAQAQLLRRVTESGESSAKYELAMRYRAGDGVERNYAEAVRWLKDAARQGNGDAQYELGNAYADGRGIARDPIAAYACYVLAGANGNLASEEALKFLTPKLTHAQVAEVRETIGQMYLQGRGTPVDVVAAYAWFSLAESAGNSDGGRDKQLLASRMSAQQIAEADRRASEWLRRHRPRPRR